MKLHNLFEQIETLEFSLNLSVLSGFNSMLLILDRSETTAQLIADVQNSDKNLQHLFARLLDVLSKFDQPQYIQFSDEALAVYLYALNKVDAHLAQQAAEQIAQTPGLWWARRLAKHILQTTVPNP